MSRPIKAEDGTIYYDHNRNCVNIFYNNEWKYIASIDVANTVDNNQILRKERKEKIIQLNGRL